jgi:ubiquinone/menaquinone biosynthesis C-methylase UbiE
MSERHDAAAFWRHEDHIAYHTRQFEQAYRSTVRLTEFLRDTIRRPEGAALDVACGAGANIYHFARTFPSYRWTGVDLAGDLAFSIGRPRFQEAGLEVELIQGDFYELTELVGGRRFDLVLCLQTLLGVPRYEPLLEQLLRVTRGWLVVSSLFTEFDVDVFNDAVDYTRPSDAQQGWHFNAYSLRRFRDLCRAGGAREIVDREFEIDIDLPRPAEGGLNTYTQRREDGQRLQFTGPIYQPWRFVGVRMGEV